MKGIQIFLNHGIFTNLFQDWISFVGGKNVLFFYVCVLYIRLYMYLEKKKKNYHHTAMKSLKKMNGFSEQEVSVSQKVPNLL